MSARRLVLWRHGRTSSNAEGRFQGQRDVALDEVGRAQARAAAAVLARLGPARIACSDLGRAADTAGALGAVTGLPVHADVELRELWAGAWEGLLHGDIARRWPGEHAAWKAGEDVAVGGGERRSEVGRRVAAAVARHAAATPEGGTLVVASHSGALRAGLLELLGLPADAWPRLSSLGNGRWAVVELRDAGWSLRGYDLAPTDALDGLFARAAPGVSAAQAPCAAPGPAADRAVDVAAVEAAVV